MAFSKVPFLFARVISTKVPPLTKAVISNLSTLLKDTEVVWHSTTNPVFPYRATVGNHELTLRVNDFPKEKLYSVMHENNPIDSLNDLPSNWTMSHSDIKPR